MTMYSAGPHQPTKMPASAVLAVRGVLRIGSIYIGCAGAAAAL